MKVNARFLAAVKQIFLNQAREIRAYMNPDFVRSGRRVSLRKWVSDDVIRGLMPYLLKER